jgi:hypothetical protein
VRELRRLQHARHAIDDVERGDLFSALPDLEVLELACLDQHVALERANRLVVGVDRGLHPRPERIELLGERAD